MDTAVSFLFHFPLRILYIYYLIVVTTMDLTPEEIKANIQKLKSKVGDARTGGKGSQRRKVVKVSKHAVLFVLLRVQMTSKSKI